MAYERESLYTGWNPWHGCTKYSPGCQYCYVYRQDEMYGSTTASSLCKKNQTFSLPVDKKRDGTYKISSGKFIFTCFTSDFLLKDADDWRPECWKMMKTRSDCVFCFFTKRIERLGDLLPDDWGDGYDNVVIGCTVENQDRADFRLPIFRALPIKHKTIVVAPILESIDLSPYLDATIDEVSVGGESGACARPCRYDWIVSLREQCVARRIPFRFHQTGANFIKDGKTYRVPRRFQSIQAKKAGLDYLISDELFPETLPLQDFRTADNFEQLRF